MTTAGYQYGQKKVSFYFDASFSKLDNIVATKNAIFITDENVFALHQQLFEQRKVIVIKPGEINKNQATVNYIIDKLIEWQAERETILIGVGGGVVTDITGYVASIYMRGISFGFIPTTLLAMVDAAIGGKNGIDVGNYKNILGRINQPDFLLYDYSILKTLPAQEWSNGFAEIIKHACIKDSNLFQFLNENTISFFQENAEQLNLLIQKNVAIKSNIVAADEFESGERKLLNFGHTIGHAIENTEQLAHGFAISIGMVAAAMISEKINAFNVVEKEKLIALLKKYNLPTEFTFPKDELIQYLLMDKKRTADAIHFILLDEIGAGVIKKIQLSEMKTLIDQLL